MYPQYNNNMMKKELTKENAGEMNKSIVTCLTFMEQG
jgi:hypothetical protein